ncbi:hypothetical protein H5410_005515 [Solanum commersonii]|uniref:Transcription repressor n=1 Tax=Solanum commersonii TaxID=4109 RepID=A0A9J6A6Z2_SOLCO|nr:hypothetical protein H5410_005515 [Solanum commersonii]
MLCRLPHCGNLRTLSIRDENNHNIFNSQRFYNNVDDDMVDEVIESLKIEKDRFFVEAGETSRSILEGSSSRLSKSTNNSTSSKMLGYLPSNDSMDAYGDQETSSILKKSKSNSSNSSNGFVYYVPCKKTYVIMRLISRNPYEDIKIFLEKMVDENLVIEDWEESLEVLCAWLLEINEKHMHKYIVGAFCDLWMSYSDYHSKVMFSKQKTENEIPEKNIDCVSSSYV